MTTTEGELEYSMVQSSYRTSFDDDDVDATATADVTITVDNDAATVPVEGDEGSRLWR